MRTRARRRPLRKCRAHGKFFGMGKQFEDGISGWYFPEQWGVKQRGVKVSKFEKDDSIDKPDTY